MLCVALAGGGTRAQGHDEGDFRGDIMKYLPLWSPAEPISPLMMENRGKMLLDLYQSQMLVLLY